MQGREKLLSRLKAIQGAPRKAARAALETGAKQIVDAAKALVPVDGGALRDSIGYTFGKFEAGYKNGLKAGGGVDDPDLSVTIHAGSKEAYYASFVEFGTSPHDLGGKFKGASHPGTAERPFFFPAYRANLKSVKSRVSRAMRKAIRESR